MIGGIKPFTSIFLSINIIKTMHYMMYVKKITCLNRLKKVCYHYIIMF
jgi:hypothetical protein